MKHENKKINVALFENILSPVLSNISVGWFELVDLLVNPENRVITDDKTAVKQFNCTKFKELDKCDYKDVAEWWPGKMKPTGNDEEPEVDFTNYERRADYPRRNKNNALGFDAIILDIDDGITWGDCLAKLKKYEYAAYTTHSNMMKKKDRVCDRFRVVIPTDRLVSFGEWEAKTQALYRKFNFIDHASITVSQPFYLPSCPAAYEFYADSRYNSGELFNFDELPVNKVEEPKETSFDHDPSAFELTPAEKNTIYNGLLYAPISRNYMGALAQSMFNCGFSLEEFTEVWRRCRDSFDKRKVNDHWKDAQKENNGWANKFWLKNAAKGKKVK